MSEETQERGSAALDRFFAVAGRSLLVALTFLLGCFEMADTDIWWHLKTGSLIHHRGVPSTDWYSFTSSQNAWIDVHWGFQLLMEGVYRTWGVGGIVFTKALVASAAIAIALTAWKREWPTAIQISVWLPAVLLLSSRIYERPETFTLLFLAAFLTILFHAGARPGLLWLLPIIQVAWSNVQGLFIFGPLLLGLFWVEAIARRGLAQGLPKRLPLITLLVLIACVTSPYGYRNLELVAQIWIKMAPEGQLYREHIAELIDIPSLWRQGGYVSPYVWLLIVLMGLGLLSCLFAWRSMLIERRLFRPLALLAFSWLGLQAARNGNHFALVAGAVIGWNFGSITGRPNVPRSIEQRPVARRATMTALTASLLALCYLVVSGHLYARWGADRRFGFKERPFYYAHDAMNVAAKPGMPDRAILFHIGHAALYIHDCGPERKVFMDGRLEVHSPRQFREYLEVEKQFSPGGDWENALAAIPVDPGRTGVTLAMIGSELNHSQQAAVFASPRWRCVHYDPVMAVFLRRDVPLPEGVREFDFRRLILSKPLDLFDQPDPGAEAAPSWSLLAPANMDRAEVDVRAERALYLGIGLTPYRSADPAMVDAIFWRAAQSAHEAIRRRPWSAETHRALGASYWFLAELAGPKKETAWTDPIDWIDVLTRGASIRRFREALRCDPNDFSSNFYLQSALLRQGGLQESVSILERLRQRLPRNRAQVTMSEDTLPKELAARTEKLAEATAGLQETLGQLKGKNQSLRFASLVAHERAGLLALGLDRVDAQESYHLSAPQASRLLSWYVRLGRIEDARKLVNGLTSEQADESAREFYLGVVDHADGRFSEARSHYQRADELDSTSAPLVGLATLSLEAGDRDAFVAYLDRAGASRASTAEGEHIARLRRLLTE